MSLLSDVTSWIYHLGDVSSETAAEIAASAAGLVVIDYSTYADGAPRPYSVSELESMRGGDAKLVVSYLSVGEAEDYRGYWDDSWNENPPDFLSASNPEWPDNFKVKYWEPEWQEIVFDYVRDIVDADFNGLYLDIIDAYYFWNDVAPNGGIDYEAEMASFVADIRAVAEERLAEIGEAGRNFVVIGQNGEELVLQPEYLEAVDGIAKEDLAFYYANGNEGSFKPVPQGWYDGSTELLEAAEAAGVEVFVVEYMTQARQAEYAEELDALHTYLSDAEMPLYVSEDRDLTDFYGQPFVAPTVPQDPPSELPEQTTPPEETAPPEVTTPPVEATPAEDTTQSPVEDGSEEEPEVVTDPGTEPEPTAAEEETPTIADPIPVVDESAPEPQIDPVPVDDVQEAEPKDEAGVTLRGTHMADDIFGSEGADALIGRGGSDMLSGGSGNDVLRGGRGLDDLFGGSGDDTLRGGRGHDYLSGGDDNDVLVGGRGDDELTGGAGDDVLKGGEGWDLFFFDMAEGHDRITDFEVGKDKVVLSENPLEILQMEAGLRVIISDESSIGIDGTDLEDLEEIFLL